MNDMLTRYRSKLNYRRAYNPRRPVSFYYDTRKIHRVTGAPFIDGSDPLIPNVYYGQGEMFRLNGDQWRVWQP